MGHLRSYFDHLSAVASSVLAGLHLTWRQLWRSRKTDPQLNIQRADYFTRTGGVATVPYPHVRIPVPDVGRYKLHNEIDDCIVCDKCANACPVNCIEIEAIRSPEEFGKTSDGTGKRIHAAKFNIDMSKCCFCGLCTTVCPTECLTMTSEYDFSTFDIRAHDFPFATMTPADVETKKAIWAQHEIEKANMRSTPPAAKPAALRPAMKPRLPQHPPNTLGE